MDDATLQHQPRFLVSQKLAMMVNRYTVTTASQDGAPAQTVAFAEQSRFAMREQVTFYRDETKRARLFTFKARQIVDLGATYDVFSRTGEQVGAFRNDASSSLLRSTWHLEPADAPAVVGSERNAFVAVLRRLRDVTPLPYQLDWVGEALQIPYHFDFARSGQPVMSVDRRWGMRDRYVVDIQDPYLDRRLAIALAVALDALQGR